MTIPHTPDQISVTLTRRQRAIIAACVRCCIGWQDPRELERFLNIDADAVRDGWSDAEMDAALEALCADPKESR